MIHCEKREVHYEKRGLYYVMVDNITNATLWTGLSVSICSEIRTSTLHIHGDYGIVNEYYRKLLKKLETQYLNGTIALEMLTDIVMVSSNNWTVDELNRYIATNVVNCNTHST